MVTNTAKSERRQACPNAFPRFTIGSVSSKYHPSSGPQLVEYRRGSDDAIKAGDPRVGPQLTRESGSHGRCQHLPLRLPLFGQFQFYPPGSSGYRGVSVECCPSASAPLPSPSPATT